MKSKFYLTKNARLYGASLFLWNCARCLPHAFLIVFLLSRGVSLTQIAALQTVFMAVAMLSEFPSGLLSDATSRKAVYLSSLVSITAAYLIIGFFSDRILLLFIAYGLYGLSSALQSGTLDMEVVIEYRRLGHDIREFSVFSSYIITVSSLTGGFLGGMLYALIGERLYLIAGFLFMLSFILGLCCRFEKTDQREERGSLISELKKGGRLLAASRELRVLLLLAVLACLFIQPFFQYWQVFYEDMGLDSRFFSLMYVIFQLAALLASCIYRLLPERMSIYLIIIAAIPCVWLIVWKLSPLAALPLVVIIFYIYAQELDVLTKRAVPESHMSSYVSLVGTAENLASAISLFLMAAAMGSFGTGASYLILFTAFALLSLITLLCMRKSPVWKPLSS